MPNPNSKAEILSLLGLRTNNVELLAQLIQNTYRPRFIRTSAAALTLTEDMAGALVISQRATAVTVTLSAGLEAGFICSFLQLGAGAITFTGTHLGGSLSGGPNTFSAAMVLDDLSWLVYGSVS